MDPFQNKGKKKRRAILEGLEGYPHSFQLTDIGRVRNKAFENLRNHLEAGLKAGYSTSLQTASTRNLLAFVLFQLEERQKALEETEEVLKMDDQRNNIVSLANKAHMLSMLNSFDDAQEALDELKGLQETSGFDYLVVKAKAELAASYTRFGPRFNKHAIDAFREVLPQAKEPEIWMWKFYLAMTYRHALDLQHAPYVSQGKYVITHKDAQNLLQEIIDSKPAAGEEAAHKNLKANACAEMALLLRLTWNKTEEYQLCSQVQTGPLACCKKALELDENDASVLWKSGKLFRNYKDLSQAKRWLQKAVSLQPSSAAYHHLGLTYKAIATDLLYGKKKTRRGGKREQRRKKAMAFRVKRLKLDGCSPIPGELGKNRNIPGSASQTQQSRATERLKKAVKSPNNPTKFDLQEPNVQDAIKNLKTAVEISAGENSRAAYDLGLMYVATGNFDEALRIFNTIAHRQNGDFATPSGLLECITSLEQMGLIYKQKAEREQDEGEKRKLTEKSKCKLNEALALASELYATTSEVKNIFGEIFQSPIALLKAAEASNRCDADKQKVKVQILYLMNSHKQSLALLRDIAEEAQDAKYYMLKIQACARSGKYKEAVATIACLKPTEQYDEVMELLDEEDGRFSLFNIYLEAGREALLDGPCSLRYFAGAFRQATQTPDHQVGDNPSTSDCDLPSLQGATAMDTSSNVPGPGELWDIMLLHDEEDEDIEDKAVRLRNILKMACGLSVVRRNENFLPGSKELGSLLSNIDKSRVVVVMPGRESVCDIFDKCVSAAAMKESTVVLLTEGLGPEAIPPELRTPRHRSMTCPTELFSPGVDPAGPYTKEFTSAICSLFKFLANKG